MKNIPSLLAQKDREIRDLKLELEDLKSENARLRAPGQRRNHRRDSAQDDATSTQHPGTPVVPSYTRPTAASVSRAHLSANHTDFPRHPANSATIRGVIYYYVDGCISEQMRTNKNTRYLNHTEASATKTVAPGRAREDGITYTTELNKKIALYNDQGSDVDGGDFGFSHHEDFDSAPTSRRIDDYNEVEVETIADSTRLRDTAFYYTQAGQVRIRFDQQLRLLKKAYAVAQDTLYNATRERWPEAWRRYYTPGPRSVRFGFSELESTIGADSGWRYVNGLDSTPPGQVSAAIMQVVPLRNAIAHPKPADTKYVDQLMGQAQNLACALQDGRRAKRIRQLRDDMQERTLQSFDEIVAYEPLSCLPGARPWAVHHQELFAQIANPPFNPDKDVELYGAAVYRAAVAWRLQDIAIGSDGPFYNASLEKQIARHHDAGASTQRQSESQECESTSAEVELPAFAGAEL